MTPTKLLILESDWRPVPEQAPTETRSAARLYATVTQGGKPLACVCKPLLQSTWQDDIRAFTGTTDNRRGVNVLILSSHGHPGPSPAAGVLAAGDGLIAYAQTLAAPMPALRRSILILDACRLGRDVEALRRSSGALGIIGFQEEVNWLASSVFILAILRHFQREGVFHVRRAGTARVRRVLQHMQSGDYADMMKKLGVAFSLVPVR